MKVSQSCPTLCDPKAYTVHGILQARMLEWGSLSLLQGIFPTQGLNPHLPHCRWILDQLCHKGSPLCLRVAEDNEQSVQVRWMSIGPNWVSLSKLLNFLEVSVSSFRKRSFLYPSNYSNSNQHLLRTSKGLYKYYLA